jgi:hypothetical protein
VGSSTSHSPSRESIAAQKARLYLREEIIEPEDIGAYKLMRHRAAMATSLASRSDIRNAEHGKQLVFLPVGRGLGLKPSTR